jgi:hypothetical protein
MSTITIKLNYNPIPFAGICKNDWGFTKEFDHIKVKTFSSSRVYIAAIKDGLKLMEIGKQMNFKEGNVYITFGKKKINIGTYEEA